MALDAYRGALRNQPSSKDAQYNFAYTLAKLKNQKQGDSKDKPEQIEPSEYAIGLKKQADEMVQRQEYSSALDIMAQGLKQDKTVEHYANFIQRLKDVTEINR